MCGMPMDAVREQAAAELLAAAQREAESRGVRVEGRAVATQAAVPMDAALTAQLREAAERAGYPARALVSGAGHDAMIVGRRVPAAMLFVRSPGGVSHHPEEAVLGEDVEAALATGMELLRSVAARVDGAYRQGDAWRRVGGRPCLTCIVSAQTRSSKQRDHLLQTPDTFVRTALPGMRNAVAVVHVGPAAGAAFTQYTAELEAGGALGATPVQRFVYVLEGVADVATVTSFHTLAAGELCVLSGAGRAYGEGERKNAAGGDRKAL